MLKTPQINKPYSEKRYWDLETKQGQNGHKTCRYKSTKQGKTFYSSGTHVTFRKP